MMILEKIRESLNARNLDGLLITNPYNRRYVTGFTGTAGAVMITNKAAMLLTDFRYIEQASDEAQNFEIVKHEGPMIEEIHSQLEKHRIERIGFESEHVTVDQLEKFTQGTSTDFLPTKRIIETLREVKSKEEIQILQEAANIADDAFEHILPYIKQGIREIDIANELEYFMRKQGASSSSFDIIVASGVRSSLPHGTASTKIIEEGELVTLDYGAIYKGYCSDTTRTVAVGKIDEQLKEIYDIVLQAQMRAVEQIKAGITGKEADRFARDYITEMGYGDYFGHSTGHGLGLEVHEGPTLSPLSDVTLQENMVVTVEPGIYLPNLGGCRIEDDIVITKDGNKRLTKATKKFIQL